jgi:hypothetical protein
MNLWELLASIAGMGVDYAATTRGEAQQQENLDSAIQRLDTSKGEVRDIYGRDSGPSFSFGGQSWGGNGTPIPIESLFNQEQTFLDALPAEDFSTGVGELSDRIRSGLRGATGAAVGAINRGRIPIGSTFDAIDYPEFSGDAYQSKALGDIAAGSAAQRTQAREQAVSRGVARGQNLQDIQPDLDALDYMIGGQAGQQARGVENTVETNRMNWGLNRAGTQAQLAAQEQAINAGLSQQEAAIIGQMAGAEAGVTSDLGKFGTTLDYNTAATLASLSGADSTNRTNLLVALRNMSNQDKQALASILAGLTSGQATGEFNYSPIIPQIYPGIASLIDARNQYGQEPKGSSSFQILGTGFTSGCIADTALVPTPTGSKPLRDLRVGDVVIDANGIETTILAKDHGLDKTFPPTVSLTTDDGQNITGTDDHIVDGKPLGEWIPGQHILNGDWPVEVTNVLMGGYMIMGDLMLTNGGDWVANGFRVESRIADVIDDIGLDKWNACVDEFGHARKEILV